MTVLLAIHILIITDTEECKTHNGGCDHICTNTNGSYYCTCHNGYDLTIDNSSCNGMKHIANIAM